MAEPTPIRSPKVGIVSVEKPFREGFLNKRLNKKLHPRWVELEDDTYTEYIGFYDPTDHWGAVDDEVEEFPDGRANRRKKRQAYR